LCCRINKQQSQAELGHPANFGECPLLEDEPPFLPGSAAPIEALFSLCPIYFFDRVPWAQIRTSVGLPA
jgi:hypothetical protein